MYISLALGVVLLCACFILAGSTASGSLGGNISAWCLLLSAAAFVVFVICFLLNLTNKALQSRVSVKYGASLPARVNVSSKSLQSLMKLFGYTKEISSIDLHMIRDIAFNGDSQPALVMSTDPLMVAAYSEDMDCVAMLEFPQKLIELYGLQVGSKLISANFYTRGRVYVKDLIQPKGKHGFSNMQPLIIDFISDDTAAVSALKNQIDEELWQHVYELGKIYLNERPGVCRSGSPLLSFKQKKG